MEPTSSDAFDAGRSPPDLESSSEELDGADEMYDEDTEEITDEDSKSPSDFEVMAFVVSLVLTILGCIPTAMACRAGKQIRATSHADDNESPISGYITPLASDNCFMTNFKDLRNGVSYYKHSAVNLFKHKKGQT